MHATMVCVQKDFQLTPHGRITCKVCYSPLSQLCLSVPSNSPSFVFPSIGRPLLRLTPFFLLGESL